MSIFSFVADIFSANEQAKSAKSASKTQARAADRGIAETRRQFDKFTELLTPFISAGEQTLQQQLGILSGGSDAISQIEESPIFQAMARQSEDALLQNQAALGKRGFGETIRGVKEMRPNILNSLLQQQFGNLGSITGLGQASAARTGAAGMQAGQNISNLLSQRGQAIAGGQLARGAYNAQMIGSLAKFVGGESNPRTAMQIGASAMGAPGGGGF